MGIFSNVMTLVIALITIFIVYKALESYGFKGGFAVCYVSAILNSFLSIRVLRLITFAVAIIPALIETAFYNLIYKKSKSFVDFFIKAVIVTILIVVGLIAFLLIFVSQNTGKNGILEIDRQNQRQLKIDKEESINVVDKGEYLLGDSVTFNNCNYEYIIKNIVIRDYLQDGNDMYYPKEGKVFVCIQYNSNIPADYYYNHPIISLENMEGKEYNGLYKIKDSKSDKESEKDIFFNESYDGKYNVNYNVYEVPASITENGILRIKITDVYKDGSKTDAYLFNYFV